MAELGSLMVNIGSKFDPEGFNKARDNLNKVALAAVAAGAALVATALKAAQAAGVQEQAEFKLAVALGNSINKTNVSIGSLVEYASELQKVTTIGDETALQVMQMGLSMGISADKIKDATTSAVGLSKSLNMDLNTAMKMTALAIEGDYNMLTRYLPALKTAKTEAEKTAIVNKAMADGFKLAQAETETYLGKVEQLKMRLGDLFEVLGKMVIPVITELVDFITDNVLPAFEAWGNNTDNVNKSSNVLTGQLKALTQVVMGFAAVAKLAGYTIASMLAFSQGNIAAWKIGLQEIENEIIKWGNRIDGVYNNTANKFQESEEKKKESAIKANSDILNNEAKTNADRTALRQAEQSQRIIDYTFTQNTIQALTDEETARRQVEMENNINNYAYMMNQKQTMDLERSEFSMNVENLMASNFASTIEGMLQGAMTFSQFIKNLWKDIANAVISEIARMIAKWLAFMALKAATGGAGGLFGKVLGFDTGGIIPGPVGAPQLILAHSGETVLPTHKGNSSFTGGNITVIVPPITTRQEARRMGEIVGNEIYRKVKAGRKV